MSQPKKFQPGDILKISLEDGTFLVYKILKVDDATETYHLFIWGPITNFPDNLDLKSLPVFVMHSPLWFGALDKESVQYLKNEPVKEEDLVGLNYYLNT